MDRGTSGVPARPRADINTTHRSQGPAATPMDAHRNGDTFCPHLDLHGIKMDSLGLTADQTLPAIRAGEYPKTSAARGQGRWRCPAKVTPRRCRS